MAFGRHHRSSYPTPPNPCKTSNCQCPCHKEKHWYDNDFLMIIIIIASVLFFLWIFLTTVFWAANLITEPTSYTLLQVFIEQVRTINYALHHLW